LSVAAQYITSFSRCYPHKTITLKSKKVGPGEWKMRVVIDGDAGDILLTEDDMMDAIRLFNRGR
jgi:hypothetical protein